MFYIQCTTVYDKIICEDPNGKYRLVDTTTETRHQAENSRIDRSSTTEIMGEPSHIFCVLRIKHTKSSLHSLNLSYFVQSV
jgi:hypothetical protein